MAEEAQTEGSGPPGDITSHAMTRDPTFVRLVADAALVIDRGGEFEFALVAFGPDPISYEADRSAHRVQMAPGYSEIARLRMDFGPAMNFAMHILESNLTSGRVDVAAFRTAIDSILAASDRLGGPSDTGQATE